MSRLYLRSCLKRASFSCVASEGDRVLGVILAGSRNAVPKFSLWRTAAQLFAVAQLFTTKTGRGIGKFFNVFDQADTQLLQDCGRTLEGEICLFAVEESARGTGVGKKLFQAARAYLEEQKTRAFYLFTDTSCTWQFYEKRGMRRLGEKIVTFQPHTNYQLNMFIYGYEFAPQS